MRTTVLKIIDQCRLVAILRLDDLTQAVELSRALLAGGILAQEFTLTNPDALRAVTDIRAAIPEFASGSAIVGIGSVRNRNEASDAIRAGAQFIVSPITSPAVLDCCRSASVPCMPGAMTPTEIASAWELGADLVKVFPARSLGPGYIKDVLAPMPHLKLMPTGGIDLQNMGAYFKNGATAVGIGGNLVDQQVIAHQNWNRITEVAAEYAQAARQP